MVSTSSTGTTITAFSLYITVVDKPDRISGKVTGCYSRIGGVFRPYQYPGHNNDLYLSTGNTRIFNEGLEVDIVGILVYLYGTH